jgi:hypothetical protein
VIDPPTYNRPLHPPDPIEIFLTKPESDDEVEIVSFGPAPGPSRLTPVIPHDAEPESDEDIVACFSHPSPNTVPYCQQKKEPDATAGQTTGVKDSDIKLEL